MTLQSSITTLKFASLFVMGCGLIFFLSLFTSLDILTHLFLDIAVWPFDSAQNLNTDEAQLLTAISGGMLFGWGMMFWVVTTDVYATNPKLGGKIILISIISWFIIDSTGSIIAGFGANAVMNISFLLFFSVPVLMHSRATAHQGA